MSVPLVMKRPSYPKRLLASALISLAGGISCMNASDRALALPAYTVTGSHLNTHSNTLPLTRIEQEQLWLWGETTPIQALRKQPYIYGNTNTEHESNGGTGSAGVNLRGLGNLSTLTLINGRRAGGNSAFGFQHGGFADLNLIPTAAIREIQIVTDGTSVAYGSDAVAGTVNVLLHDIYTGSRVDASYSDTTDGDASEKTLSFLTGQDLTDDTHLVLMGGWYQRNAIFARDRDISADADRRDQGGQNQGSPTFPGHITVDGTEYILDEGIGVPTDLSDYREFDAIEDLYNFSEFAPAIPEVERKHLMANLSHNLKPNLQIWTELLYTESEFENGLAPAPWSGSTFAPTILDAARISPYLPAGISPDELTQVNYRSFELGNLDITQEKEAYRSLLGLRGTINEWNWESAASLIQVKDTHRYGGIADANALANLIESGDFNPFAAEFSSGSGFDNAAALTEAERNPVNNYDEDYWSYDLKVDGELFEIPAGIITAATGLEYRSEQIDVGIDPLFESGNQLGGPTASSFAAKRHVTSLFAETRIPLLRTGTHSLDAGFSARYESYNDDEDDGRDIDSNSYDAFVYKGSLFYSPNNAVSLYAAYGTSFRAPTLTESYGAEQLSSYIYNDPTGPTPDSTRVFTFISGNPDLDPEESTNFNFGITYEPEPDRGWRANLNYYRIRTEDAIVNSGQDVVNRDEGGVVRDGEGNLFLVFAEWFNAAEVETDGIDLTVSYTQPTSSGYWQAELGVSQVFNYDIKTVSGEPSVSYLGRLVDPRASNENIAGPGSIPEYKGYAQLIWSYENLTLGGTINYIHELEDNQSFTADGDSRTIDEWISLDLLASYSWPSTTNTWLHDTTLTVGIDNVTNEEPPFAAGAFADGYDASLYSLEGRRVRISLSRRF